MQRFGDLLFGAVLPVELSSGLYGSRSLAGIFEDLPRIVLAMEKRAVESVSYTILDSRCARLLSNLPMPAPLPCQSSVTTAPFPEGCSLRKNWKKNPTNTPRDSYAREGDEEGKAAAYLSKHLALRLSRDRDIHHPVFHHGIRE